MEASVGAHDDAELLPEPLLSSTEDPDILPNSRRTDAIDRCSSAVDVTTRASIRSAGGMSRRRLTKPTERASAWVFSREKALRKIEKRSSVALCEALSA